MAQKKSSNLNRSLLLQSIFLCEGAGILGSLFTFPSIKTWYITLLKPSFSPPNWIFGPIWTTLYALMGIALFLILTHKKQKRNRHALFVFGIQLLLNILWSLVFFGGHSIAGGLIAIAALWIFIVLSLIEFARISKPAGLLLLPYLFWVSFASILNLSLYLLNP